MRRVSIAKDELGGWWNVFGEDRMDSWIAIYIADVFIHGKVR